MIKKITKESISFVLSTAHTTYVMRVMPTGQLENLYYGRKIMVTDPEILVEKHAFAPGNSILYDQKHPQFSLEDICLETSGYGKGDIREAMITLVCRDGSSTVDFVYEADEIKKGKTPFETLPGSYGTEDEVEHLCILLKDKNHGFHMQLNYYVFANEDVISRSAVFINDSNEKVMLTRMLSYQLDLNASDYFISSFHGGWTKEMNRTDLTLSGGKFVNSSFTGTSSNRSNPFFMMGRKDTTEDLGECFGFNLIYSGNHYEAAEVNAFQKTRIVAGINPENFRYELEPGERFEAPEAVLTYSSHGYNGMSHHMHAFVKKHIVRGKWANKERPVLLNSWEAAYFKIDEGKLLKLAKAGKEAGIELFVMDDGWFGNREDDHKALGDWTPDKKKLPGGLKGLCDKINALGMEFGIWVEPEMVNTDSELYREHPAWSMEIPNMEHSEGRNQRILDFANPKVVSYMTKKMEDVFGSAPIAYVKWDMNRIVSDAYSQYLTPEHQGEVYHRYVLGLYRMMKTLTEKFPNILFEGCASGGCRFDLGILCYFPQIWASDNSDAISRLTIQNGYSYGYPQSTYTAHVSTCPNHQTLRVTPLETRFAVAAFGVLGYECNLCDMNKEEFEAVKNQIALYKKYRAVLQQGTFYRRRFGNVTEWTIVSEDQKTAVGMVVQKEAEPGHMYEVYKPVGLKETAQYHFFGRELKYNIKAFGDLINTATPIHVKPDSVVHNVLAKLIHMDGETEECVAGGDTLMYAGVKLHQAFVGTGYSDDVRFFPDFGSRLYFMEEVTSDNAGTENGLENEK